MMRMFVSSVFVAAFVCAGAAQQPAGQDLSGTWSITVFGSSWKLDLKLADSKKDKDGQTLFCGRSIRDEKDKDGKEVNAETCLWHFAKEAKLRVLHSGGAIACEAPFKTEGTMDGKCVFMSAQEGAFKATRMSGK